MKSVSEIIRRATTGSFDDVFTEVECADVITELTNSNLRLFYLSDIEDKSFDTKGLAKLLRRNLGQYCFSRGKFQQYIDEGDVVSIGLDAASSLRDLDSNRIFEEFMICLLLEDRLHAPKLLSRPEILSASGRFKSQSDSIHILPSPEGTRAISFKMIFGTAKVHRFIDEAIPEVFEKIIAIDELKTDENYLVDEMLFNRSFDKDTTEYLSQLLKPSKARPDGKRVVRENAYGVFIGYSLDLDARSLSPDQHIDYIERKMRQDLKHFIPEIEKRICDAGLENNTFYFFFIPMNDAEDEKETIIREVLR